MIENKIKDSASLKKIVSYLKKHSKKIVFTNGCFDILHKGHIKLLKSAKALGDVLVVAINSDDSVKKIKGPNRPINSARDRAFVLSAISFVDFITIFREGDPACTIKELKPDVLVKGGDWKKDEIIGRDIVESAGGKVVSIPLIKGCSTSRIIKKISKQS